MLGFLEILEGIGFCLEALDFVGWLVEIVAWVRGRRNRVERRTARREGAPKVPLDVWNTMFLILLLPVLLVTAVILWHTFFGN